jgi:basic membrane protein A
MAPRGFLTGAEWAWGTVYAKYAWMIRSGHTVMNGGIPRRVTGTLKDEFCKLSPFGPSVSPTARARVAAAKARILDGSLEIYRGPIKDNEGSIAIAAGKTLKITDVALDRMNWMVEGVEGRAH